MNPHTIRILDYDKILKTLASFCAFGGGEELATSLLPSDDLRTINEWMQQTDEACRLLDQKTDIYFGGVHDVRQLIAKSERGSILIPTELVDVRTTLMRAHTLRNTLTRLSRQFPRLADIAFAIEPCEHVIGEISRCINDRAEVVDSASAELGRIRAQLRVAQDRLLSTLDRLVQNVDVSLIYRKRSSPSARAAMSSPCARSTKARLRVSSTINRPAAPPSLSNR